MLLTEIVTRLSSAFIQRLCFSKLWFAFDFLTKVQLQWR